MFKMDGKRLRSSGGGYTIQHHINPKLTDGALRGPVSSQSLIAVYSCVIPLSSVLLLLVQKSLINLHDAISCQSSPACVAFTEALNVSHSCYTQLASLTFFTIL